MALKAQQSTEPVVQQALLGRASKGARESKDSELAAGFVFCVSRSVIKICNSLYVVCTHWLHLSYARNWLSCGFD